MSKGYRIRRCLQRSRRGAERRTCLLLLLWALGTAGTAAQVVSGGGSAGLLDQARSAFGSGQLLQAESALRSYIADEPHPASEALYLLGRVLEGEHKAAESLTWFTKAAAVSPPSGDDLRVVGRDYVLLNDYPSAAHWLTRAVELSPNDAEAWYDLARVRMTQQEFQAAEVLMKRSLALNPRLVKAEDNLGVIYESENRPVDAAAAYRQALAWQVGFPHPSEQPFLNYGTLLLSLQRGGEALPLLKRAVEISPDDVRCNEQLARALDLQGDLPGAITRMENAVRLAPKEPRLHYQLGMIYRRAGQAEKGREEMELSGRLYGEHSSETQR
jgi:tetratricopeptide (TPR) repeat protein